jgi:hypothetical protein
MILPLPIYMGNYILIKFIAQSLFQFFILKFEFLSHISVDKFIILNNKTNRDKLKLKSFDKPKNIYELVGAFSY